MRRRRWDGSRTEPRGVGRVTWGGTGGAPTSALPYPQYNTNDLTESTGSGSRRHRSMKDIAVLRPAVLGWCRKTQAWPTALGGCRQALRGAFCAKKERSQLIIAF